MPRLAPPLESRARISRSVATPRSSRRSPARKWAVSAQACDSFDRAPTSEVGPRGQGRRGNARECDAEACPGERRQARTERVNGRVWCWRLAPKRPGWPSARSGRSRPGSTAAGSRCRSGSPPPRPWMSWRQPLRLAASRPSACLRWIRRGTGAGGSSSGAGFTGRARRFFISIAAPLPPSTSEPCSARRRARPTW